jgi:hypothetical protein
VPAEDVAATVPDPDPEAVQMRVISARESEVDRVRDSERLTRAASRFAPIT